MTLDRAEGLPERCIYSDPYEVEGFEDEDVDPADDADDAEDEP